MKTDLTAEETAEFEQFWRLYPRRIAKGAARSAWRKARSLAGLQELLDGVLRYATQTEGQEVRYICHPGTWLRQERWTDDPQALGERKGKAPDKGEPDPWVEARKTWLRPWDLILRSWLPGKFWPDVYGPCPGKPGCQVPKEVLDKLFWKK